MNKKLNIVHVVGELDPNDLGGAEIHIVEVIRELLRRGHNLHLFVGADDSCKCLFPFENVKVYPVKYPAIKNLRSFIFAKAARREVLKFLKTHPEIDLVHSKQVFPQGLAGTKICKKTGLPHYLTVQNPLAYIEELVLQIPLLPRFVNQVMQNVLKPLAKKALRGADVIACVSTYSEGRSLAMVPGLKSEIVPNGVDTEKFSPSKQEKNMDAGSVRLCTTSTLIPRNGIDTLIRGFALVAKKHSGAHLDIAGQGPLEADLRKLVKDLDVEKQVTFLGTIKHEEVPALLRKSHLFVRPSRAEGFGVSFVEAMACGVPVVTCPSGGIIDFVKNGETGMLVLPDEPEKLAEAILQVIENPDLYQNLTKNSLELVRKQYQWNCIVDQVENLYYRLTS